jgi:murein DD-endopeptidase MepM/ murein hydrolase activator NlpD
MTRDDRFYAFVIARTYRSRARIRRICFHKSWLKVSAVALFTVMCGLAYGFYGLTQQANHLRIEHENARLRAENDKQRQELQNLNHRVEAVEDTSRKLAAEVPGAQSDDQTPHGQGGPARPVDSAAALAALETKTANLEREMRMYEAFLRQHGMIPSIWPVIGKLESGVGGRRNPFGGRGFEYHEGQDIDAAKGTPVQVAASGRVIIAGWQRGYGNVVYVDHGAGLSTRYGHLSEIDVSVGQSVTRGQKIGLVGSTGRSTGPHLHYEVRINNQPVDPLPYLPGAEK